LLLSIDLTLTNTINTNVFFNDVSSGSDASMAALTSLIQQGAAANVYKTNLIDSPAEVLTFGLSLFGCFAISLLLGVCVGWKLFKGSGGGGGGGGKDHSPFGTDNPAASKQDAAYGDVEMPKYNNPLEDASSAPKPGPRPVKRSSNDPAVAVEVSAKDLEDLEDPPLPPGWIQKTSSTHGKVYFYNVSVVC
jgi:hypothetical protein